MIVHNLFDWHCHRLIFPVTKQLRVLDKLLIDFLVAWTPKITHPLSFIKPHTLKTISTPRDGIFKQPPSDPYFGDFILYCCKHGIALNYSRAQYSIALGICVAWLKLQVWIPKGFPGKCHVDVVSQLGHSKTDATFETTQKRLEMCFNQNILAWSRTRGNWLRLATRGYYLRVTHTSVDTAKKEAGMFAKMKKTLWGI